MQNTKNVSQILFGNSLCIEDIAEKDAPQIEYIKELLSRVMFATAGFYKNIGDETFTVHMSLKDSPRHLSIYVDDSRCHLGIYNYKTKTLSTNIKREQFQLDTKEIESYITRLSRSEDYYRRNRKLPSVMTDTDMLRRWKDIVSQRKARRLPEPTKLSEILQKDKSNISLMFWEEIKTASSKMINHQITPNNIDLER